MNLSKKAGPKRVREKNRTEIHKQASIAKFKKKGKENCISICEKKNIEPYI